MSGQVGEAIEGASASPRFRRSSRMQRQAFNRATIGRRLEVLFEKPGRREGQVIGRSPYMQSVFAEGPQSLIGALAQVEILARRAAFAARTHCLDSVVNRGLSWRER